jgi:FAD:protein FMN transferase
MRWSKHAGIALLTLLSCAAASVSESSTAFVDKKKYAMGTVFEIVAYDSSPERAATAIDKAFEEIIRLDTVLSNYDPDSELSRLNRSAHFRPHRVSADLYRIVGDAIQYSTISGGKFDITVGPLVDLWKTALRSGIAPSAQEESATRACVGYDKIKLVPPDQIEFRSSCLRIDVGGIGKGYAVDRAVDVLRKLGITRALLDAGGSTIFAMGSPPSQTGWLTHLHDPSRRLDPQILLSDRSVSTSEQTPPSLLQNQSAGHIIDPETGVPSKSPFAVSVIANTATASDALSTTLLLVGPSAGKLIVETLPGAAALWLAPTGKAEVASAGPEIILHHQVQNGSPLGAESASGAHR